MVLRGELLWIARHYKQIPSPVVVWERGAACASAFYEWPTRGGPVKIGQGEYSVPWGAIVLCQDTGPATIAHEYRHHLQWLEFGCWSVPQGGSYDSYYKLCPYERDALAFEAALCGEDEVSSKHSPMAVGRTEALTHWLRPTAELLAWPTA